ncbi:hypothetical protein XAP412_1100092 [Xanthomonas phaseoli pv. phaseoli]|uniref:Uncharacterized protein n=1 Tax=Xanthomonas campestris pv. phaseoli TaxID=317013 RepID=A0AB38DWX0_XANCH|nr:hypothetical protein XAP412_1100092 [Xanthomonas phaseoli pv. phaseoli]SON76337.1 hypothetical protein XAP6984_1150092 [Xanthomonas phaseoli pv. phaseoli]SON80340.1 hypothetical protein XAP7430_1120093 [Xanthomonas phaseoli pv. phaseoli]SOO30877.1 hypothetical protein XAP6164_4840011 [Xanthomonas phaseoli pv. phaseoli]
MVSGCKKTFDQRVRRRQTYWHMTTISAESFLCGRVFMRIAGTSGMTMPVSTPGAPPAGQAISRTYALTQSSNRC